METVQFESCDCKLNGFWQSFKDLNRFQRFIQLCAGRIGQLLNVSSLANDTGVSHTTAGNWLSLLEAGYIIFQLQPYFRNISKRLVKSPKLYFYDVGMEFFRGLNHLAKVFPDNIPRGGVLVCGGESPQKRTDVTIVPVSHLDDLWNFSPDPAGGKNA